VEVSELTGKMFSIPRNSVQEVPQAQKTDYQKWQ
jgi:hypothetical protein